MFTPVKTRTVFSVHNFEAGLIVGLILGGLIGNWIGGWRAIMHVSQIAHRDLMGRAGLRRRR